MRLSRKVSPATDPTLDASRPLRPAHRYFEGASDYLQPVFTRYLAGHEFRSIFELGSRDGRDAMALQRTLGGHVHAFECNPHALELCRLRLDSEPHVTLVPLAVWSKTRRSPS